MTTAAYMSGRQKYGRPQAVLFSENSGTLEGGKYIPLGYEVNADVPDGTDASLIDQFIILSDDNRSPIDVGKQRIEKRERMVNGRMRSYHVADKISLSLSWENLPSRSFASKPSFGTDGKASVDAYGYTTDGGAGGADLLDWYNNHTGSFWVFLSYDHPSTFGSGDASYAHLNQYSHLVEMFIADFSHTVAKRGSNTHDFWNVSIKLEEA